MMTSMSYSRYRRIAIAIAPGTPSRIATSAKTNATLATDELSHPQATNEPKATACAASATAAAKATHLICWRSSRSADRYRTISDANEAPATATVVRTETTRTVDTT